MAPPSSNASRPGRALAVLAALIVVLLLALLASDLASPGSWSKAFRVHLGLDLTSGTTVELRAVKPDTVRLCEKRLRVVRREAESPRVKCQQLFFHHQRAKRQVRLSARTDNEMQIGRRIAQQARDQRDTLPGIEPLEFVDE